MKNKFLTACLLGFACVAAAGLATANYPPDGVQYEYIYYSKTSPGTVVGGRIIGCGVNQSWGVRTTSVEMVRSDCGF